MATDFIKENRRVRIALADAARAIRNALGDDLWVHDDVADVLDSIWTAWARRGTVMRDIDPDCYSAARNTEDD